MWKILMDWERILIVSFSHSAGGESSGFLAFRVQGCG